MIPGLNSNLITKDKEKESAAKIQRFLTCMDSMTKEELDSVKPLCEKRIKRIARGAGVHPAEIHFLIQQHAQMGTMVKRLGSFANMAPPDMQQMKRNPQQAMQNMRKQIDPKMIQQMGGMDNIMKMAQSMGVNKGGGMPDMNQMMQMMGGGGGGGMPDMGGMMKMMQGMMGGGGPGGGGGME